MKHLQTFESFLNEGKGEQFKEDWEAYGYWDMSITGDSVDLLNDFMKDSKSSPDDIAFLPKSDMSDSEFSKKENELKRARVQYIIWDNDEDNETYLVFNAQ